MSSAEERRRAKEAYLANLESQRQKAAVQQNVGEGTNAGPAGFGNGALPDEALSERDRKWEERRMQFLKKNQNESAAPAPAPAPTQFAAPAFRQPQQQQQQQFAGAPDPTAVNLKAFKVAGYPSEYAYAQAVGALDIKQERRQPPEPAAPEMLPRLGLEPEAQRREKQALYAMQLEQQMLDKQNRPLSDQIPGGGGLRGLGEIDPEAQRRGKARQAAAYAQQLEIDQRNKPANDDDYSGAGALGRGGALAMQDGYAAEAPRREKQALYAMQLEQQMLDKQNRPLSDQLPGGGGLRGLGGEKDADPEAKRRAKAQYALQLEMDQRNKQIKDDDFYPGPGMGGDGGIAAMPLGLAADVQRRDKQALYAQQLEQQMLDKQNRPLSDQIPGGGGLRGLGEADQGPDAQRRARAKQALYAKQLELDQLSKPRNDEEGANIGGGLRNIGREGSEIEAKRREMQSQYAHELEKQMISKRNMEANGFAPDGVGLQGIGDEGLNIVNARRQKSQEYAQQLQMQMELRKQQKVMDRAQDRMDRMQPDSDRSNPSARPVHSNEPARRAIEQQLYRQPQPPPQSQPVYAPYQQQQQQQQQQEQQYQQYQQFAEPPPLSVGSLQNIGGYEDDLKAAKRAKQSEYARALQEQQLIHQRIEADRLSNQLQQIELKNVHQDASAQAKKSLADGWVMGPLGVPVRKTLEVGSRLVQKAYNQSAGSPQKLKQWQMPLPAPAPIPEHSTYYGDAAFGGGGGYGEGASSYLSQALPAYPHPYQAQPLHHHQQGYIPQQQQHPPPAIYPPQQMVAAPYYPQQQMPTAEQMMYGQQSMVVPSNGKVVMHAGAPYVPTGPGGLPWQLPLSADQAELQDERNLVAKARQQDQARALEAQIHANKAKLEAERRAREDEEARELARLEKERAEIAMAFEREKTQLKLKAEEDAHLALQQQIAEKKRQKLEEERREREEAEKENERIRKEQEELRRRELEELRLEAIGAVHHKKGPADLSPYKSPRQNKQRQSPRNSTPPKQKVLGSPRVDDPAPNAISEPQMDEALVAHLQAEALRAQQEAQEARQELVELRRAYAESQRDKASQRAVTPIQFSDMDEEMLLPRFRSDQHRQPESRFIHPPQQQSLKASGSATVRNALAVAPWVDRRPDGAVDEGYELDKTMKTESRFVFPDGTAFLPRQTTHSQDKLLTKPVEDEYLRTAAATLKGKSGQLLPGGIKPAPITRLETGKIVDDDSPRIQQPRYNDDGDDDDEGDDEERLRAERAKDLLSENELEGIIRKNRRKWDLLKRFETDNVNSRGEALDLLVGSLNGVNSRPSTAGSTTPSTPLGSSRPNSSAQLLHQQLIYGGQGASSGRQRPHPVAAVRPRSAISMGGKAVVNSHADERYEYHFHLRPQTAMSDYGL